MKEPAIPSDEEERLKILDDLGIIYTPAEERFDRITRLAMRIFDVPIALISLVTANTEWFKSCQGLKITESPRKVSFSGHVILGNDTFIIPDALDDSDFSDNPLVVNEPNFRFYAGHPVKLNSVVLGTLCIIDQSPRRITPVDFDNLKSLARCVESEFKLSLYMASQKELEEKISMLQRKSMVDSLTGRWSRRGMEKLLDNEVNRSHRQNDPISLLLIDIESTIIGAIKHLSAETVDNILKEFALRIRTSVRSHDIIGHVEKYQFLVCMSNCNKQMYKSLAQRVLRNIAVSRMKLDDSYIALSAHIGSTSNEDTDIWSPTLLQETAKEALQKVKEENTRNNIHMLIPKIGM